MMTANTSWLNSGAIHAGLLLALASVPAASIASADVTLDCTTNGLTTLVPAPGETVDIAIAIDGDATDFYTSAVFRVVFTAPGMVLDEYVFASPFDTGTFLDGSLPGVKSLPVSIEHETLEGSGYPSETADLLFDNFLLSGFASPGDLLELSISIPEDFPTGDSVYVAVVPDEIADGFDILESASGTVLELVVEEARPTDLNRDGVVDGADLGLLVANWGVLGSIPEGIRNPDFNDDGFINGIELGLMLASWG